MSLFVNASPEFIPLGTDDQSIRPIPPEEMGQSQHMAKVYIKAQKGKTIPLPLTGAEALLLYGSETFNKDGKYYNHSTRFLEYLAANGRVMIQRIVDSAVKQRANIAIYLDILQEDVPNYVRTHTGGYVIDPDTNDYKVDEDNETIDGHTIKYIIEYTTEDRDLGLLTDKDGTIVRYDDDGNETARSRMYPILEFKAAEVGEWYNNLAINIKKMYEKDINGDILTETKSLPYKLSILRRDDVNSTPVVFRTLDGAPDAMISLKDKVIDPLSLAKFDIKTVFDSKWYNEADPYMSLRYKEFEGMYVYQNYLTDVLSQIMTYEKEHITTEVTTWDDDLDSDTLSWFDFTTDDKDELQNNELYLLDALTTLSSKNVHYFTVVVDEGEADLKEGQREVSLGGDIPIFLNGGTDGDLSEDKFNKEVITQLRKYGDPDSEVQDMAVNWESVMYDSGYPIEVKEEMVQFISLRKDTVLALSTHEDKLGNKDLDLAGCRAVASVLKTRLKLAPESVYYGTPVARAVIIAGTGTIVNSNDDRRIPLTLELAIKSGAMMGGEDFKWNSALVFDHGDAAIVKELVNIHPAFIPAGVKPAMWKDGVVWVQPKNRVQYAFPAIQTVYDNDTSVLNSWFTIIAITALNKINYKVWSEFTGTSTMSDAEFTVKVQEYLNKLTTGIFDGLIDVSNEVVITDEDEARGYVWRTISKLYAGNMKTKMITTIEANRK
jgi:hypothetical protein